MIWNEIQSIIEVDEMELLQALPEYQQLSVNELLENNYDLENVAIKWLTTTTGNTSPFSSHKDNRNSYFDIIKKELYKLLCGDSKYEKERKEINHIIYSDNNKTLLISSISSIIGSQVGLSASFIAPVIVLIMMTITKVSVNAWCELYK